VLDRPAAPLHIRRTTISLDSCLRRYVTLFETVNTVCTPTVKCQMRLSCVQLELQSHIHPQNRLIHEHIHAYTPNHATHTYTHTTPRIHTLLTHTTQHIRTTHHAHTYVKFRKGFLKLVHFGALLTLLSLHHLRAAAAQWLSYGQNNRDSIPRRGREIFLFATESRPTLGLT
jgi:hypothetical protein